MNALIVLAHPEPQSFNAHLARVAHDALIGAGHDVRISDLYASGFDPCEAGRHFSPRREALRFDAQLEQRHHWEQRSLPADVAREAEHILWADLVILQFPLWWFGPPAILKGWMDRCFVYGGLYSGSRRHDTGPCRGKRAVVCVTTGSSAAACSPDGREGDTRLLLWPSLYALRYLGFTVVEPMLIHGVRGDLTGPPAQALHHQLDEHARVYASSLLRLDEQPTVPFNSADDWDEHGVLVRGAPEHSPFIRHVR